jgi:acyl-CoA oxidase
MQAKMGKGAPLFDVWMGEESDTIQAAAKAYGERICFEQTLKVIANVSGGAK